MMVSFAYAAQFFLQSTNDLSGADPVGAALCFYKGLKVYPEPRSLIGIYDNTVPKNVLEILAQMVSHDKSLNVGSFGESKDSGSESGHGVE
jgi:import receptor subunit TOM20